MRERARSEPAPQNAPPYRTLRLGRPDAALDARLWQAPPDAQAGVLLVGGIGGGWDSPAQGLYDRLGPELARMGIHALRLRYRQPHDLDACTDDALAGLRHLESLGVERAGLVGHSLGGAVVVRAAAASPLARTVVALATQSHGAAAVGGFDDACSILLIHGEQDTVLPAVCSLQLYEMAGGPREIILLPDAGHVLDEAADVVHDEVLAWLADELTSGGPAGKAS